MTPTELSTEPDHYIDRHVAQVAAAKGRVIVAPGPNELFLDIDSEAALGVFERHVAIVEKILLLSWTKRPSPGGQPDHWHIVVTLVEPVEDAIERILLQALLGSDLWHEVLSWRSAKLGAAQPTVFFELPESAPIEAAVQ